MTTIPKDVLDGKAPVAWMTESGVSRLYDVTSREVVSISASWSDSPNCVPLYLKPQAMGWARHKDFDGLWRVLFSGHAQTIDHRRSNDFVIVEHQVSGGRWLFTRDEFEVKFDPIDEVPTAAPVSSAPAIPKGWRLVPIEPTAEMHKAAWDSFENDMFPGRDWTPVNVKCWAAMLAAAPEPPAAVDPVKEQMAEALRASDQCVHDLLHLVVQLIAIVRKKSPSAADTIQAEADKLFEKWPRTKAAAALAAYEKEARHG